MAYGVGFIGKGKYKSKDENGKDTKIYKTWSHMLERCYGSKIKEKRKTYDECTVCEEWHNFQNFAKWFEENYYQIDNRTMHLDKDIIAKDNKIYSPKTCVFVDNRINTLFTKTNKTRGEYPIGVYFKKQNNSFCAQCSVYNGEKKQQKHLGYFSDSTNAFLAYKNFKEQYIKQIADEYKEKYPNFPEKLYKAMYDYVVEITD